MHTHCLLHLLKHEAMLAAMITDIPVGTIEPLLANLTCLLGHSVLKTGVNRVLVCQWLSRIDAGFADSSQKRIWKGKAFTEFIKDTC